ncbi:MAG: MaoC family dehydratase [Woeseia sp.]|nr:MaoC family dehydratase [Woeseia sp.]NNE60872.1 MaoC family dehydratase [Woeseia sp.]NNL55791.1 MaoC family dehydratase [Woeseia sp.]
MLTVPRDQLDSYIDKPLPASDWLRIDQQQINAFADATLDHQFIHIDPEKARATPFGSTIAHGYLTLSLISYFIAECGIAPENVQMAVNYGTDKVRFLEPVRVDSDVRAVACLKEVREKKPGQILIKTHITVEIKGAENPALIAEVLSLFICA